MAKVHIADLGALHTAILFIILNHVAHDRDKFGAINASLVAIFEPIYDQIFASYLDYKSN